MKVGKFGALLTRCDQEAAIYVIENGVRYLCTLINTKNGIYIGPDRLNHVRPGVEIGAMRQKVSQEGENPEN